MIIEICFVLFSLLPFLTFSSEKIMSLERLKYPVPSLIIFVLIRYFFHILILPFIIFFLHWLNRKIQGLFNRTPLNYRPYIFQEI